jgi:16S rRNA (uracil1498-N3)-methyltransferase
VTDAQAAPRFLVAEEFAPGATVTLGEEAVRHMRVLRLGLGASVLLLDGAGRRAFGTIRTTAKRNATVEIESVDDVLPLSPVHLLVPIADRDRMLTLAEKAAEFAITSWRPVLWKRSRSVVPRGEGSGFQRKVQARMESALEQSGGAWLPTTYPDSTLERVVASLPEGARFVLDPEGVPAASVAGTWSGGVTFALGPEGGLEPSEREALIADGFTPLSLGRSVLRFETAGIAAIALARALGPSTSPVV